MNRTMATSQLIQRLAHPIGGPKPYAKGLGKTGDVDKVNEFCIHDYMGAAEFEYGALGSTYKELRKLAVANKLYHWQLTVADGKIKVYVLGNVDEKTDINQLIVGLSNNEVRTKEYTDFPTPRYGAQRIIGWLDIENYFMFFVDRPMFEEFVKFYDAPEKTTR